MAIPTEVFIQIGAYLLIVIAILVIINRVMGGFLFVWFKVRQKRDFKLLTKVNTPIGNYFRAADVSEGWLVYQPAGKKKDEKKRISLSQGCVYRAFNVLCVDVDDEKNCVFTKNMTAVSGYDAEKNNTLHLRALYKPMLMDDKTKIILVILIVVVIAIIISALMNYSSGQKILAGIEALKTISSTTSSHVIPTGAV